MNIICLADDAFYELIKQVVSKLKENEPKNEADWIDGEEAMQILKCKKTKLQELRNSGEIKFSKPSKKIIVYYRPSLMEYLKKHTRDTF